MNNNNNNDNNKYLQNNKMEILSLEMCVKKISFGT